MGVLPEFLISPSSSGNCKGTSEASVASHLIEIIGYKSARLLLDSVPDLEKLQVQLTVVYEFLKDKQLEKHQVFLNRIRDVICDIEDALDDYVSRSGILGKGYCLWGSELNAKCTLKRRIKVLTERVISIAFTSERYLTKKVDPDAMVKEWSNQDLFVEREEDLKSTVSAQKLVNQDLFVGRVEDLKKLKSSLLEETGDSPISIVGMGGLGKTTLAQKIYSEVRHEFQCSGWVNLSNKVDFKSFLQELMFQLSMESHEKVLTLSQVDLLLQLHKIQLERRCLIVLDDVWSTDAWSNLQLAFPSKQSGSSAKLLVTTRIREVAEMVAAKSGILYDLKCFSEDESWELISRIALHPALDFDAAMELIAKDIARKCNGLPLAVKLLGGHLARKHTLREWTLLDQNIVLGKWKGEQEKGIKQLLALIFLDLPLKLKQCLLYLAVFLENSEIEADKLYKLWIAEGLVQSSYGGSTETLLEIADHNLQELASRGMVEVEEDEISRVRKFRSCRLNSMIRDMSLLRAKEENYLTVIDLRHSKQLTSGTSGKVRKIAAHLGGNNKGRCGISDGQKKTNKIHSLILLGNCQSKHKSFQEERLCLKFKVLRVLHFDGLNFGAGKYPKHIENLVFLKYLSFRDCYLEKLPSSISNLLNLQTLDLRVRDRCLVTISNVLRKLGRMKHLYLPKLFCVHNDDKLRLDTLKELETLENFNSKLCVAEDLLQLINLQFLTASIHENLEDLETTIKCINSTSNYLCEASLHIRSFHCYPKGKQVAIQKLFLCTGLSTLHLEGYLGKLPVIASSILSVMLFSSSEFDQDPMPLLGKLPHLRVLVLYNYAFIGKQLLCPTMSFNELRHLKLSTLPNLENLIVEEGTMPKLSGLTIEECKNLKLHPNQLKFLGNLKQTKIRGTAGAFEELHVL